MSKISQVDALTLELADAQATIARLERRVDELLAANNAEVERRRDAVRQLCQYDKFPVHLTAERFQKAIEAEEENAALRRALDAAQLVRGADPLPAPVVMRD